jgi:adenine-specific DNA glycosylase
MTAPKLHRHLASYHKFSETERQHIQQELLKWFDLEKRTHLPWRKEWDPTLDKEQRAQRAYEGMTLSQMRVMAAIYHQYQLYKHAYLQFFIM